MRLTKREKQRYLRHSLLDEIGEAGQEKLMQAKVLVIGAGGLGCPVLQYLAAAGVGKLGIIDDDVVEVSNLQRQILYAEKDIGLPKVYAAKKRLQQMNSFLEVVAYYERLSTRNAKAIFSEYDIIVEGSDSFSTKYLANDAAVITGKPLVFGSIFKFEGQVSVFNYQNGPTYRCLFPEPTSIESMPTCSEVGVLGILPGIIGDLQANEVLKMIFGVGEVLSGKLFLFNTLDMQAQIFPFSKNPNIKIKILEELDLGCQIPEDLLSFEDYKQQKKTFSLLDVRRVEEREVFDIGGQHIPLAELEQNIDEVDTENPVLVYCASGKRSQAAISLLKKFYPKNKFYNLKGGLNMLTNNKKA